jgi:hypothetical protein
MKTIPSKVAIGPYDIKIVYKDNLILERQSFGEWHPKTGEIWIDPAQGHIEKWETLIHECVEATNSIFNLETDHHNMTVIATGLTQALKSILEEK